MARNNNTPRSQLLRTARTRALARLRAMFDPEYQRLLDEEIDRLGGEPRTEKMRQDYRPRADWNQKGSARDRGKRDD
jgi:hypothetical protein